MAGLLSAGAGCSSDGASTTVCGDGTVEQNEVCDGDCPTACDDHNMCSEDTLIGSAATCDADCVFTPIDDCTGGDGCCTAGCTVAVDSDCATRGGVVVDAAAPLDVFPAGLFGTVYGRPHGEEIALAADAGFVLFEVLAPTMPADPTDPSAYDFAAVDEAVASIIGIGGAPMVWFSPNQVPTDLAAYGTYAANVARHLTSGWGDGHIWPVTLYRFGNEPDTGALWPGTRQEFFDTYAAWAKALKEVNRDFLLEAPGLMATDSGPTNPAINGWVTEMLDACQANDVPIDFFSFHTYSSLPYRFWSDVERVRDALDAYDGLSSAFGAPKPANDEWNALVGDVWAGSYHSESSRL